MLEHLLLLVPIGNIGLVYFIFQVQHPVLLPNTCIAPAPRKCTIHAFGPNLNVYGYMFSHP